MVDSVSPQPVACVTGFVPNQSCSSYPQAAAEQRDNTLVQLEAAGVALLNMKVMEKKSGLGGRTLVTLEKHRGGVKGLLPAHRFTSGDIIAIRDASSAKVKGEQQSGDERGLVYRTFETHLVIALDGQVCHAVSPGNVPDICLRKTLRFALRPCHPRP